MKKIYYVIWNETRDCMMTVYGLKSNFNLIAIENNHVTNKIQAKAILKEMKTWHKDKLKVRKIRVIF